MRPRRSTVVVFVVSFTALVALESVLYGAILYIYVDSGWYDYATCFTPPPARAEDLEQLLNALVLPLWLASERFCWAVPQCDDAESIVVIGHPTYLLLLAAIPTGAFAGARRIQARRAEPE